MTKGENMNELTTEVINTVKNDTKTINQKAIEIQQNNTELQRIEKELQKTIERFKVQEVLSFTLLTETKTLEDSVDIIIHTCNGINKLYSKLYTQCKE